LPGDECSGAGALCKNALHQNGFSRINFDIFP
jgi:hypothetical protein